MDENVDPMVIAGSEPGEEDMVIIENLYLVTTTEDGDPDEDPDEDLGEIHTAYLFDPDNMPEEALTGPVGAFPLKVTRLQAMFLKNQLDRILK